MPRPVDLDFIRGNSVGIWEQHREHLPIFAFILSESCAAWKTVRKWRDDASYARIKPGISHLDQKEWGTWSF